MSLAANCPPGGIGEAKYYSLVGGTCVKQASFFGGTNILSQGLGYGVVLGFGALFAVITSALMWIQQRYVGTNLSSEYFNTAGRSVKTGLIAAVIVSQWTWAATILQSSNVAWKNGVSGPFWYASGATVQVLLFGVIAVEIKRKAPNAHTFCEMIKARWGSTTHLVFLGFAFMTNIIVTAMLLLGGAAVVNALTGMNVIAASFLIPIGVIVYTLAGGLQATFLAAYLHSAVVHVALCLFVFLVYTSSSQLGSPGAVYHKLVAVASATRDCSLTQPGQHCGPVAGNKGGSYLTMWSTDGLIFGIINIIGNFGTVFVDNGYWMSAIAARPTSAHKGYLVGGLIWFAVPFSLGTSLGLAAVALDLPLTAAEANAGLVPPATAVALMGKGGAALLLVMLFMAVTSAGSSELIAVSSLVTYDIYRTYINPRATGKEILNCSRGMVIGFGLFMGVLAYALNEAKVSLGWVYLFMGVMIGSAVVPVSLCILWSKANNFGAVLGAVIGMVAGLSSWLGVTAVHYGTISIDTTGNNAPMLTGNLVSILTGGFVHIVLSLIWPQNFDWEAMRNLEVVETSGPSDLDEEYGEEELLHAKWWIVRWGITFTTCILIAWPLLALPAGVFNEGYFSFWAILSVVWGTVGSAVVIFLPLYESMDTFSLVFRGMILGEQPPEDIPLKQVSEGTYNTEGEGEAFPKM